MFDYFVRTNSWVLTSGECHPAGQITPWMAHTDDCHPPIIDLKRNRQVSFGTSTAVSGHPGGICTPYSPGQPSGSTDVFGVLAQDLTTRVWTALINANATYPNFPGVDGVAMQALWDPVTDLYIATNSENVRFISPTTFANVYTVPVRFVGPTGQNLVSSPVVQPDGRVWWQNEFNSLPSFCLDVIGRRLYFMVAATIGPDAGSTSYWGARFLSIDLDTRVLTHLPTPPVPQPSPGDGTIRGLGGNAPGLVFDTKNRTVLFFWTRDEGARVHGVYVYPVATGVWSQIPVQTDTALQGNPAGSMVVYNPDENVTVLGGTYSGGDYGDPGLKNAVWLWRYQ